LPKSTRNKEYPCSITRTTTAMIYLIGEGRTYSIPISGCLFILRVHYRVPYPGGKADEGLLCLPYALDTNDYKVGCRPVLTSVRSNGNSLQPPPQKNAGYSAFMSPEQFSSYLIAALDELYAEGENGQPKMLSIGLHCRNIGRPGRIAGLREFLKHASSKPGVWFATREEIARHWTQKYPYSPPSN
jgi:peptidoglycan/xylan/chitin deacetylase (PgdA/CDA1 family)